jgi:hypothetical protein
MDVCTLSGFDRLFDTVIDIGCFHSLGALPDGAAAEASYASALREACKSDAVLYLRAFSASNPQPRDYTGYVPSVTENQIRTALSAGWVIDSLEEKKIAVVVPGEVLQVYAWFAAIRRA